MKTIFITAGFAAALACALFLAGCGSGGGTTPAIQTTPAPTATPSVTTGRAQISLRWPEKPTASRGRLIPLDAQSVRVSFIDASGVVQTTLLPRPPGVNPTSTATFTDLPTGTLLVRAIAYPNADGTGVVQASANDVAVIVEGQTATVPLTLGSAIVRVEILPFNVQFTGFEPITLTAVAYDSINNVVLTNQWRWENSDDTIISLVPNGGTATIQAKNVGTSVVTLTETESGQFATKTLQVTSNNP